MRTIRCRRPRPWKNAARWVALLVVWGALVFACMPAPQVLRPIPTAIEPTLRVGLAVGVPQVEIELGGRTRVVLDDSIVAMIDGDGALHLLAQGNSLSVRAPDGRDFPAAASVRLEPDPGAEVRLGGDAFAGTLEAQAYAGALTLVNVVGLEAYLRGVIPWEIGRHDANALAALEAQAIASRTYACNRRGQYPGYDLVAGVGDQVYRGRAREDSLANWAIRATRGLVLCSDGRLAETYYCSTCGGHTSRIEQVWNKPSQPYLRGRRDASTFDAPAFCTASPHFRWVEGWSGGELQALLAEVLPIELGVTGDIGRVTDVRAGEYDASGRLRTLEIHTTRFLYRVHGDRIRWVLRPQGRPILRSTLVTLEAQHQAGGLARLIVRGGGNGHGVGMCQMGALEMARRGHARDAILAHYYPDTRVERLY